MSQRQQQHKIHAQYDVCKVHRYQQEGEDKVAFYKCGTAFPMRKREGFSVTLFFTVEHGSELVLFPRTERTKQ